jgi:AcrR family transcriptional regulator
VSSADVPVPTASALKLVVAAERLFARHGIDGVSLRQIAGDAGSGNNSAVHYHFGSKAGLVAAIFRHRLPQIISERRLLTARCDPGDLRSRIEAHFLPVLTMAEAPDNHYVSFVEQIQRLDLHAVDDLLELPEEGLRSNEELQSDLHHLLSHLDEPIRELRIHEGQAFCLHAAADRDRAVSSGTAAVPFGLWSNSFFDGVTGYLAAPVSVETQRHIRRSDDSSASRLRLL